MARYCAEAPVIDTVKIPTVGLASSRSSKHRSGSKAGSSSKRRSVISGLSPTELLAKIDALDWDETVSDETTVLVDGADRKPYPDHSTSAWRVAAIIATMVAVLAILYAVLMPESRTKPPQPVVAQSAPIEAPKIAEPPPLPISDPVPSSPEPAIIEIPPTVEPVADDGAKKAQRRAERKRKAREAELARQAQQERERQRQQEAAAKQLAEREAAEAARAAKARELAAAAKAPSSPQQVCAGESNFFARGLCETRTCSLAEWRKHPFCVKRIDDQLRAINRGIN